MSRDTFKSPNLTETPEERKVRETNGLQNHKDLSEKKLSERFGVTKEDIASAHEEFLATIDFKKLKNIFLEIYRKCGLDPESIYFVASEGIISGLKFGYYEPEIGYIGILPANLDPDKFSTENSYITETFRSMKEETVKQYGSMDIFMTLILVHEETHAMAKNICIGAEGGHGNADYTQSGYRRTAAPKSLTWEENDIPSFLDEPISKVVAPETTRVNSYSIFIALNEAVVEKLARRVSSEYLNQTHSNQEALNVYRTNLQKHPENFAYSEEIGLVDLMVAKIAKFAGISEEKVFQSLIRGLVEGEIFADKDVQELFDKALGPSFLKEVSQIDHTESPSKMKRFREIIDKYSDSTS